MARISKPDFGSRHYRPAAQSTAGEPGGQRRRVDWLLVTLVAVVFVASFVFLF